MVLVNAELRVIVRTVVRTVWNQNSVMVTLKVRIKAEATLRIKMFCVNLSPVVRL